MHDLSNVHDALNLARSEATATATNATEPLNSINAEPQHTTDTMQKAVRETKNSRTAAKEATETKKILVGLVRDLKSASHGGQSMMPPTYAAMQRHTITSIGAHNVQSYKATPAQAMCEIIVNTKNPPTVVNMRTMSPRNLKAHVDRAIEQSGVWLGRLSLPS